MAGPTDDLQNSLFQQSPLPTLTYEPATLTIRHANRAATTELGYPQRDLLGRPLSDLTSHAPTQRPQSATVGERPGGDPVCWRVHRRSGTTFDADVVTGDAVITGERLRIAVLHPRTNGVRPGSSARQQHLQRSDEQRRVLTRLATTPAVAEGRFPAASEAVLRSGAEALKTRRVSFWRLDPATRSLRCECLYDRDTDQFLHASMLNLSRSPSYLAFVDSVRVLTVDDAQRDPRTRDIAADYLGPTGIGALLDAVVRVRGRAVGMLCHEHVAAPRVWHEDESRFAGELADQFAQALLADERRRYSDRLHTVMAGVAVETGDRFFRGLVTHLARALEAICVFVAQIHRDCPDRIRTLALARRGHVSEDTDLEIPGTPCEQVLRHGQFVVPEGLRQQYPDNDELAALGAESYLGTRLTDRDGTVMGVLVAVRTQPLTRHQPEATALLRVFADRAAGELARMRRETHLRRAAALFETTREGVVIADADGSILESNPAMTTLTGFPSEEIAEQSLVDLVASPDSAVDADLLMPVAGGQQRQGEVQLFRRSGERFPAWMTLTTLRSDETHEAQTLALFSDISEIRRSEADLQHLAHHDPLTGLPNRTLFSDRLAHALESSHRSGRIAAVLFLDLDGFKDVNDSLGHSEGDRLLRRVARRLEEATREGDTLARIGGDEFTILIENLASEEEVIPTAQRLCDMFAPSFRVADHEIYITASIGIGLYPRDGVTADMIVQCADAAMYAAKSAGKNTFRFFMPSLTERAFERVALVTALRTALQGNEFHLAYQAQVDLDHGQLTGCEALLRWQHPERGMIPPVDFIPIAEASGLIVPLGQWVLEEVCRQGREWLDAGFDFGRIAVNVAGAQITRPGFAEEVFAILDDSGMPGARLTIEITESLFLDPGATVAETLALIRGAGVEIAIDDFGTGYSSLAYLKRLPIDILKLDKSFTSDLPDDADDVSIARAIVGLAGTLGLSVIAEGIETSRQQTFLTSLGCRRGQGFLFGRPSPAEQFRTATAVVHS